MLENNRSGLPIAIVNHYLLHFNEDLKLIMPNLV